MHQDHLGSSSVITGNIGQLMEISDYYPYGNVRFDQTYNGFDDRKGYLGKDYDPATNLSYLEARYYDGSTGRFISEDPVFWRIGTNLQDPIQQEFLTDPQNQNAYAYGRNNPLNNKDPDGRFSTPVRKYLNAYGQMVRNVVSRAGSTVKRGWDKTVDFSVMVTDARLKWMNEHPDETQLIIGLFTEGMGRIGAGAKTGSKQLRLLPEEGYGSMGNRTPLVGKSSLPNEAQAMLEQLEANGFRPVKGYRGGSVFQNRDNYLPYKSDPNYYREWDVKVTENGVNRGTERLVTGKQGEAYYTNTHYGDEPGVEFYKVGK